MGPVAHYRKLAKLPPAVALFRLRAERMARRRGDEWALGAASTPQSVAMLLSLANGHERVVELGTATGWMTAAFALTNPRRLVTSYDPYGPENERRRDYLALAGGAAARIDLRNIKGADGAKEHDAVDFVFIDSSHDRQETVDEFRAWEPVVRPGGLIVFHDYRQPEFPGVTEAIHEELNLEGEHHVDSFVWRKA